MRIFLESNIDILLIAINYVIAVDRMYIMNIISCILKYDVQCKVRKGSCKSLRCCIGKNIKLENV